MYFGLHDLGNNVPLWVLCTNDGVTPKTPDAAPTYTIYEEGTDTSVASGTMTGQVDSKTGLYRVSVTASSGNGFARGRTYLVHFSYAVTSTSYAQTGTFTVV